MAKAGFWAIDPTRKISFGKDGWWYANDERIHNRRINVLFSQHLQKAPDGSYEIVIGWDRVTVEIDDAPYVVTRVNGDSEQGFTLCLNDENEEPLDPATLFMNQENVLYCRVKGKEHLARFLRPAYYQLAEYVQGNEENGTFWLPLQKHTYAITISSQHSEAD